MAIDVGNPSDPALKGIPLGRSRAIAVIAALLLDATLRVTAPKVAAGYDCCPPSPCSTTVGVCHCCRSGGCVGYSATPTCFSGGQCWYVCVSCTDRYQCCDYEHYESTTQSYMPCTCSTYINGGGCTPC